MVMKAGAGWVVVVFSVSVVVVVLSTTTTEAVPGGWTPIQNLNDQTVVEIANFAVAEYDKRSGAKLKLSKVIKGDTQVVAGTNYRLLLSTTDGKTYEAIVWDKPWQHFRKLTSFNPLPA